MTPRVSVVIPSYNARDDFLEDCLSSLELQTMPAWEAIVVDDGSTRGDVKRVVATFGDERLRTVRQENRGMGGARNSGFHAARADLVLTLDADDRIDPSFLDVAVAALDADAETDCIFMDSQRFGTARPSGTSQTRSHLAVRSTRPFLTAVSSCESAYGKTRVATHKTGPWRASSGGTFGSPESSVACTSSTSPSRSTCIARILTRRA